MNTMSRTSTPSSSSQEDLTLAPERTTTPRPQTPLHNEDSAAELSLEEITVRYAIEREQRDARRTVLAEKNEHGLFAKQAEENRLREENRLAEEKKKVEAEQQAKSNASKFAFAGNKDAERPKEKTNQGCKCTMM
jgi:hypothetical protein